MKDLSKTWLEAASLDLESARRLSDDDFLTPLWCFIVNKWLKKPSRRSWKN